MERKLVRSRKDIIDLYKAIEDILQRSESSYKFNYALIKNKKILKPLFEEINKELIDLDRTRETLCREYCKKDEKGNPIVIKENGKSQYDGLQAGQSQEFDKKIEELFALKDTFISENVDFIPYLISIECVPEKMVGVWQEQIQDLIYDPNLIKSKSNEIVLN